MKIEKLSLNKIRVTVSEGELNIWDINPREISPDMPQLKNFVASLLKQSCNEIGEELFGSNVLVEARPQGEDFVFVITCVGNDYENIQKEIAKSVKKQKFLRGDYKARAYKESAYSYFEFATLCDFSHMLKSVGIKELEATKLYKSNDKFYLQIERAHPDFERICMIMSEYASATHHARSFCAYIEEHANAYATHKDFDAISRCY